MNRCRPHPRQPRTASRSACACTPAAGGPRWTRSTSATAARFAYLDGHLPDGEVMPLCRLRYGGSASSWGFAIYLASRDGYEDSILPTGHTAGSPEEALDCACGLYLNDPTAWADQTPAQ